MADNGRHTLAWYIKHFKDPESGYETDEIKCLIKQARFHAMNCGGDLGNPNTWLLDHPDTCQCPNATTSEDKHKRGSPKRLAHSASDGGAHTPPPPKKQRGDSDLLDALKEAQGLMTPTSYGIFMRAKVKDYGDANAPAAGDSTTSKPAPPVATSSSKKIGTALQNMQKVVTSQVEFTNKSTGGTLAVIAVQEIKEWDISPTTEEQEQFLAALCQNGEQAVFVRHFEPIDSGVPLGTWRCTLCDDSAMGENARRIFFHDHKPLAKFRKQAKKPLRHEVISQHLLHSQSTPTLHTLHANVHHACHCYITYA